MQDRNDFGYTPVISIKNSVRGYDARSYFESENQRSLAVVGTAIRMRSYFANEFS